MEKLSGREALTRIGHPAATQDAKRQATALNALGIRFEQVKSGQRVFSLVDPADVEAYVQRERIRLEEERRKRLAEERVTSAAIKAVATPGDTTALQSQITSLADIVLETAANTETIMGSLSKIAEAILSLRADMKRIADELVGPAPSVNDQQLPLPLTGKAATTPRHPDAGKVPFSRGDDKTAATTGKPLKPGEWPDRPILSGPVRPDPIVGKR